MESDLVWPERDGAGVPLTGAGVVIADFDTGVDVFHPLFFHPDGGSFDWIDVDRSREITMGNDAVDLNRDGFADPSETLQNLDVTYASPCGVPPILFVYEPGRDWLYADRNRNGRRDFGPAAGYNDAFPSFGEPLFVPEDLDGDGRIEPGEPLIALGTSKIRAVRERDGRVRRRGVDLVRAERDDRLPHGTWVAGSLLGGVASVSSFAGHAPGADLIMVDLTYPGGPPFEDDLTSLALWARDEGARVMLHETGNWVWSYLDGSGANEVVLSDLAAEGYVQLTATGNLGGGGQLRTVVAPAAATQLLTLTTPAGRDVRTLWPSLLFRGLPGEVTVTLELPGGTVLTPCYCATTETLGGFSVYSDRSVSPRGTTMLNFEIREQTWTEVAGSFVFHVTPARDLTIHARSWDDRSGWNGVTRWALADDLHTVTGPATADASIAIAGYEKSTCAPGPIGDFSGRGPRLDGVSVVDVAAPADFVGPCPDGWIWGCVHGGLERFAGTSAALAQAAGAAALLAQLNPNDPHEVIERLLRGAALADAEVGPVPNDTWGMGRLRLRAAYERAVRPSLLREDSVTALQPLTPAKPLLFPPDAQPTALRLAGGNGFSREGEGGSLSLPGSSDGDAFLLAHVDTGTADPEGATMVEDASRPLVFFELTFDAVLRLARGPAGITVHY